MTLTLQLYREQLSRWPQSGRHILAHFDENSIVVYQAFRASIAQYAVEHQRFGGDFSYGRMSWIKPNFLWMMYRSGWAAKDGQEHILAVRLHRNFFDQLLESAVPSTFGSSRYSNQGEWQAEVAKSDVRLQWDPDHDPFGGCVSRRAVQLGLRREMLRQYGQDACLSIEDITPFVLEQRAHLRDGLLDLRTPVERIYLATTEAAKRAMGLDS